MGIYGFGKAFNIRYAHNQYRPMMRMGGGPRGPILGNHSYSETTNITIKNGPSGFWGFMSGLFGGLFGGGMTSGMFGGNMFGGGFGMNMGCFSPFGALNTAMAQPTAQAKSGDRLADLQKMYPDWKITSDGNGKYDAVNKDGTVHQSGNFDEMCEKLLKEKQGTDPAKDKDKVDDSNNDKVNNDDGKSRKTTNEDDGNGAGKTGKNDGNGSQGIAAHHSTRSTGSAKTKAKSGVSVPNDWYRADTKSQEGKHLNLKGCQTASAVLDKLLSAKVDYLSSADRTQLTKELIHNNPSVFDQSGKVKAGANFDKLDVPSIKYIKAKYVGKANYNKKSGTVSYTSKQGNGVNTNYKNSTMKGVGGRTIKGNNGYYVRTSNSGNVYYDPKGNKISPTDFKEKCPHIYAQVNGQAVSKSSNKNVAAQRERANSGHTHAGSRQPWL